MKKHANIPIFIPHVGCPHDCVFCNQKTISGRADFDISRVKTELDAAFATLSPEREAQIAYFGGSFTAIDRAQMEALLDISDRYIEAGKCTSVRISTRPDYITPEILDILAIHHVKTIELGVQSMDDRVLLAAGRGHTAEDTKRAFSLILERGFELVGQMMTGLPEATAESEIMTAESICRMGAHAARLYPTVVFEHTALCDMARRGLYTPFDTETAVSRSADVLSVFIRNGVPVIRIGLQASEALVGGEGVYGGGYHPAIGEMILARRHRNEVEKALFGLETKGKTLILRVNPRDVSAFAGQKGENKRHLIETYALSGVGIIPDPARLPYTFTDSLR